MGTLEDGNYVLLTLQSQISTYINRPVNKLCPSEITSKQSENEPKIRFAKEKTIPKMNTE